MTQRRQILRELQKSNLDPSVNYVASKGKLVPKKGLASSLTVETKKPEDDKKSVAHVETSDNVVVEQQAVVDAIVPSETNSFSTDETVVDTTVDLVEDVTLLKKSKKKK